MQYVWISILDSYGLDYEKDLGKGENGIRWNFTSKLDDLDFADDVALLSSTKQHTQNKTTKMNEEARQVGLKINKKRGERHICQTQKICNSRNIMKRNKLRLFKILVVPRLLYGCETYRTSSQEARAEKKVRSASKQTLSI